KMAKLRRGLDGISGPGEKSGPAGARGPVRLAGAPSIEVSAVAGHRGVPCGGRAMARFVLLKERIALCADIGLGASVPTLHLGRSAAHTAILVLSARDPGGAVSVDAGDSTGFPEGPLLGPAMRVSAAVGDFRVAVFLARREQIAGICSAPATTLCDPHRCRT